MILKDNVYSNLSLCGNILKVLLQTNSFCLVFSVHIASFMMILFYNMMCLIFYMECSLQYDTCETLPGIKYWKCWGRGGGWCMCAYYKYIYIYKNIIKMHAVNDGILHVRTLLKYQILMFITQTPGRRYFHNITLWKLSCHVTCSHVQRVSYPEGNLLCQQGELESSWQGLSSLASAVEVRSWATPGERSWEGPWEGLRGRMQKQHQLSRTSGWLKKGRIGRKSWHLLLLCTGAAELSMSYRAHLAGRGRWGEREKSILGYWRAQPNTPTLYETCHMFKLKLVWLEPAAKIHWIFSSNNFVAHWLFLLCDHYFAFVACLNLLCNEPVYCTIEVRCVRCLNTPAMQTPEAE